MRRRRWRVGRARDREAASRPAIERRPWGTVPVEQALADLESSRQGLTAAEAARRLAAVQAGGAGRVAGGRERGRWAILAGQFASPLVLVLAGASAISFFLGELVEGSVILAILGINAVLGFVQEGHAEHAARELRKLLMPRARALRDGVETAVPAALLVPGDLVRLALGEVVVADLRLIEAEDLALDESALTGESLPVAKSAGEGEGGGLGGEVPGAIRSSLALAGSSVVGGRGAGLVVATGGDTALGHAEAALERAAPPTEFERGIHAFSDLLLWVVLGMTLFVFAANALAGKGPFDSLLFALALAVGITPEALPVIVTLSLSRGALRLSRRQVVVRRLAAIEDLGNLDTFCCDKTGTLTEGAAALAAALSADGAESAGAALWATLCAEPDNPLDRALLASPQAAEVAAARAGWRVASAREFDFARRRMSVVAHGPEGGWLVVKGAPESVLEVATARRTGDGGTEPLAPAAVAAERRRVAAWEEEGLRVLAVAIRPLAPEETADEPAEEGLALAGWLLFLDPPKPGVGEALARLRRLGVAVKILSGDSPRVVARIARDVGLAREGPAQVTTGGELTAMTPQERAAAVLRRDLFARVAPEQKLELVAALRSAGHVVGFLGDGVNDAPALRTADVGVSVDTATGVAREAADVLLLDKSLAVLAVGIEEGRRTFANVTKYVLNTISANFGNMWTVAATSLFLPFIPLLPSQILLNNLLSDAPLVTLAGDRVDRETLRRPRRWDLGLIARFMAYFGLLSAVFDLLLIALLLPALGVGVAAFRTAWFVESACSEMLVTFAVRTRRPLWSSAPSPWLLATSAAALAAAWALPYTSLGQAWFGFEPLTGPVALAVAAVLAAYLAAAEAAKRWFFAREERRARPVRHPRLRPPWKGRHRRLGRRAGGVRPP